jgi:NAD+ synthetase
MFNAEKVTKDLIKWIQEYFVSSDGKNIVIGISGGKDSTICAELCARAVGRMNVYGLILPDGEQKDLNEAIAVCRHIGIKYEILNIEKLSKEMLSLLKETFHCLPMTDAYKYNTPARLRMTMLYGLATLMGGRVCCTSNLSEEYIGWNTKWGDAVGDFAPLLDFTAMEVREIGEVLNLPRKFIYKTPIDGMREGSDEKAFGFSYDKLDLYLRKEEFDFQVNYYDNDISKINKMHNQASHKRNPIPKFEYKPEI